MGMACSNPLRRPVLCGTHLRCLLKIVKSVEKCRFERKNIILFFTERVKYDCDDHLFIFIIGC